MPNHFPPPETASPEGLLAIGGNLECSTLIEAYSQGVFPWPLGENYPLTWFSPDPRGIIFFNKLHIPHSLKKFIKKNPYTVHFNRNFNLVIDLCAKSNRKGHKTWILPEMQNAYINLHKAGYAFSVEVDYQGELAGGLYGVNLGFALAGESMFYLKKNASKLALISLIQHLKNKNIHWLDTQMVTDVTAALGAENISRREFLILLKEAKENHILKAGFTPNQIIFPC